MAELRQIFKLIEDGTPLNTPPLTGSALQTRALAIDAILNKPTSRGYQLISAKINIENALNNPDSEEYKKLVAEIAKMCATKESAKHAAEEAELKAEEKALEAASEKAALEASEETMPPGDELTPAEIKKPTPEKVAAEEVDTILSGEWSSQKQKIFNNLSRGQRFDLAKNEKDPSKLKPYIQNTSTRNTAHLLTDFTASKDLGQRPFTEANQKQYDERIERRNILFNYCETNAQKAEVLYRCELTEEGHKTRSELLSSSSPEDIRGMLSTMNKTITHPGAFQGQSQKAAFLSVTNSQHLATTVCLAGAEHIMPYLTAEKSAMVLNNLVTGNLGPTPQPLPGLAPNATPGEITAYAQQKAVEAAVNIAEAEGQTKLAKNDPTLSLQSTFSKMDPHHRTTLMQKTEPAQAATLLNKLNMGTVKEIFPELRAQQQASFLNLNLDAGKGPNKNQTAAFQTITDPQKQIEMLSDPSVSQNQSQYTNTMTPDAANKLALAAQQRMREMEDAKRAQTTAPAPNVAPVPAAPLAPGATPPPLPQGPRPVAGSQASVEDTAADQKTRARSISQPGAPQPSTQPTPQASSTPQPRPSVSAQPGATPPPLPPRPPSGYNAMSDAAAKEGGTALSIMDKLGPERDAQAEKLNNKRNSGQTDFKNDPDQNKFNNLQSNINSISKASGKSPPAGGAAPGAAPVPTVPI